MVGVYGQAMHAGDALRHESLPATLAPLPGNGQQGCVTAAITSAVLRQRHVTWPRRELGKRPRPQRMLPLAARAAMDS